MAMTVLPVEYFYTTVDDKPCRAFELLARGAAEDINLLAFSALGDHPKPASRDHPKTGQLQTRNQDKNCCTLLEIFRQAFSYFSYSAVAAAVLVRQLRGPHFNTWP